jgi:DNA-binding NtrC family response regulator
MTRLKELNPFVVLQYNFIYMHEKILIVDDYKALANFLAESLLKNGITKEVYKAYSPNDFFAHPSIGHLNLVILDLSLRSESTGMEILRYIAEAHPNLPVIIYSLHNHQESIKEARKLGAIGFISKLTPLNSVLNTVKNATIDSSFFIVDDSLRLNESTLN